MADRIEAVLGAAEDAAQALRAEAASALASAQRDAARVRMEAETEAELLLADARRDARDLVDRATSLLRRIDEGAPRAPRAGRGHHWHLGEHEGARLMALQMAMAGRSRAEVESDLRHGLHVDAPEAILDDVFGKGTGGDQRIPWSGVAKGEAV